MYLFCKKCDRRRRCVRAGKRKYTEREVQQYKCCTCGHRFTLRSELFKGRKFGEACIVKAISLYNLGHSMEGMRDKLAKEFAVSPGKSTIENWLRDYRKYYSANHIKSANLKAKHVNHSGRYLLKVHHGKLANTGFGALSDYLTQSKFNEYVYNSPLGSCSTIKAECISKPDKIPDSRISRFTDFALSVPHRNFQRHSIVLDYLLANDSRTVATEVPVHLKKGEIPGLNADITGHIDLLQVKNGRIYILDYKPKLKKEAIKQTYLYALALSKRTGIHIKNFVCGWFNHKAAFFLSQGSVC